MPIELITGLPGCGKSLGLIERMMQLREREPERPVYVHGIPELRPGTAVEITAEQVMAWRDFPPSSIVIVDECQDIFPARRQGDPPLFIKDLSRHRHAGIDFVFSTQNPSYVDAYVRGLVGKHVHQIRKFGGPVVDRFTWPDCVTSLTSKAERKRALRSKWKFPSKYFEYYKSADAHTIKKRVPWKVYAMWAMVVAVVLGAVAAVVMLERTRSSSLASASGGAVPAVAGASGAAASKGGPAVMYATAADYAHAFLPRVADQPWSAPAYDGQAVKSVPDLMCITYEAPVNGAKVCQCYTEQATRYHIPPAECFRAAAEGVYNPHRPPLAGDESASRGGGSAEGGARHVDAAGRSGPAVHSGVEGAAPSGGAGGLAAPYNPAVFLPSSG